MDGDAPESTDPISLARQVVEDAIKLAACRDRGRRRGAEAGDHPAGDRGGDDHGRASSFLLIAVIEALGALPSGLGILGAEWVRWLALGGVFLVLAAVLIYLRPVKGEKGDQTGAETGGSNVEGGCRVAPGTDEAQRQRELSKQALATSAGRLEQRVRAELDWKARLRRDGPRYAAIAGGAVAADRDDRPDPLTPATRRARGGDGAGRRWTISSPSSRSSARRSRRAATRRRSGRRSCSAG